MLKKTLLWIVLNFYLILHSHQNKIENKIIHFSISQRNTTSVYDVERRRLSKVYEDDAPLFQGQGTHYAFIWVGTPPQRVSVIVDTGSHHTAFPCVGCQCGKHVSYS